MRVGTLNMKSQISSYFAKINSLVNYFEDKNKTQQSVFERDRTILCEDNLEN